MNSTATAATPAKPLPAKNKLGSLRALWPFVQRHFGLFCAWLLALGVASAATLTFPQAARRMIDQGFHSGGEIDRSFGFLFVVAIVLAFASAARYYFVTLLGEKVVADLRRRLYAHLLALDADFHDSNRSGELVSRLSADSELLRSVVGSGMSVALRSSVTVIGSAAMLFVTNPKLAAYALIGIPLAIAPIIIGSRQVSKTSRAAQDRVADANTLAAETLGAVRTVQAHARENYERGRFGAAVDNTIATARKRIRTQSIVTAVAITLVFGAITAVLWSGAHDVIAGKMSAGTLGQFVLYALIGGGSVGALAETWNDLQRAAGGMGRISELLVQQAKILASENPRALPQPLRGEIAFEHVGFRYSSRPDTPAIDDFSLHVKPGETIALVGPSGAGKSTVFSLLLRFHDVESGHIAVDGVDVREVSPQDLRERIALVPQQPTIFAASAAENIRYGKLDASDDEVRAAAVAAEADNFIVALPERYDSQLGERGGRLSGGQRQRIAIARAMLKNPPLLLLDEATSALDAESERMVQAALEAAMADRTTLVIAHRLATVEQADRILVLHEGRIAESGSHAELLGRGGLYSQLHRLQFNA